MEEPTKRQIEKLTELVDQVDAADCVRDDEVFRRFVKDLKEDPDRFAKERMAIPPREVREKLQ